MPSSTNSRPEELLADLVHDLRQPLGNIETSVYLLNRITPPNQAVAQAQLRAIEQQTRAAARLLSEAAAALVRFRNQRLEAESFDLTNPLTSAVT